MALLSTTAGAGGRLAQGQKVRPRTPLLELQRARLIAAVIETVEEDGYAGLTVGKVIARSRVSRKTFYDIFRDREDGFLAAFEQTAARIRLLGIEAYTAEPDWQEGIRAALQRLLVFFDREPGLARLFVVDSLGAGERVLARRVELLYEVAWAVDLARSSAASYDPPPLTAEALVGGALAILHARVSHVRHEPLTALLGALMSMIVLPYLGELEAREELERACEEPARLIAGLGHATNGDPLKQLKIRVTYRTVRTLMAIGERPGASNRDVGQGAGIVDQGQISKLLSRLARLELIQNNGEGQAKGGANAWYLTARGALFEKAVRPR